MSVTGCVLLQAPLTTRDTAVLSGSLSTHNGNGGGNINVAVRRVTSAKGWGEVRRSLWRADALLVCRINFCVHAGGVRSRRHPGTPLRIEDIPKPDASLVCAGCRTGCRPWSGAHRLCSAPAASSPVSVGCSSPPEACVLGSPRSWPATWTRTLWATCSGDGEASPR